MKRLFLSSAALVASGGLAAAEIAVGGDASMGVKYDGSDVSVAHDVDLELAFSGQTDGGLSFGVAAVFTNQHGVTSTVTSMPNVVSVDLSLDYGDDTKRLARIETGSGTTHYADDGSTPVFSYESIGQNGTRLASSGMQVYLDSGVILPGQGVYNRDLGSGDFVATPVTKGQQFVALGAGDDGSALVSGIQWEHVDVTDDSTSNYNLDQISVMYLDENRYAVSPIAFDTSSASTGLPSNADAASSNNELAVVQRDADGNWSLVYIYDYNGDDLTATGGSAPSGFAGRVADGDLDAGNDDVTGDAATVSAEAQAVLENIRMRLGEYTVFVNDPTAPAIVTDTMDKMATGTLEYTQSVADGSASGTLNNDATVHLSGGFGKITVGSVDAADAGAVGMGDIGYDGIGVDDVAEALRNKSSADFLYEFSAAGAGIAISADAGGDDAALGVAQNKLAGVSMGGCGQAAGGGRRWPLQSSRRNYRGSRAAAVSPHCRGRFR